MKKEMLSIVLMLSFLSVFIMPVASAQYYGSSGGYFSSFTLSVESLSSWLEYNVGPYFNYLLGGQGNFLFERILLFFILFSVIFVVLNKTPIFKSNTSASVIVTLAVSLLSTRFLGDFEFVQNILAPYQVLGVSLSAVLPLIIYFFFVHSFEESSTLRKILWIFFIVIFFGIWADRQAELGRIAYIYALVGIVALVLLLADGTVRRALLKDKIRLAGANSAEEFARKIRNQLYELNDDYNKKKSISTEFYNKERRRFFWK